MLALLGPWGEGKTSVRNLAVEALQSLPIERRPVVAEFNAWQWAGHEELATAFFEQIAIGLGRADATARGRRRAAKWRAYAAYLRVGSRALAPFRNVLPFILGFLTAIGGSVAVYAVQSTVWRVLIFGLAVVVGLLLWAGNLAEGIAVSISARLEAKRLSLSETKNELVQLLTGLSKPLLVVLDDIDRLSDEQLKIIFQLVKANADFPNLVYLLLFQRDLVEKSLEQSQSGVGKEFLEKIVQVAFDVPVADRTRVEAVLFNGLDEILERERVAQRFDRQRWGNVFVAGLKPYFENLRSVRRFLATLSFQIGMLQSGDSLEVNPVDLIALEVLRVFEPRIYETLQNMKSVLTSGRSQIGRGEAETRSQLESVVNLSTLRRQAAVREILKQLFPTVAWVWGGVTYGANIPDEWLRDLRICSPQIFDRYFQLVIPQGDISQAEIDALLATVADRASLVARLRSLNEQKLLALALERLEAYKESIDIAHALPFISGLLDVGDDLPAASRGIFDMEPHTHVARVIHWYLMQEADVSKRGNILLQAYRETTGFFLPIRLTYLEERIGPPESPAVSPASLTELRALCLQRISGAAASSALRSHKERAFILHRWQQWSAADEAKRWVAKLITTDEGFLDFLSPFVGEVQVRGKFKSGEWRTMFPGSSGG